MAARPWRPTLGTSPWPINAERRTGYDSVAIGGEDAGGRRLKNGGQVSGPPVAAGNGYFPGDRLPECAVRRLEDRNLWHVIRTKPKLPGWQVVNAGTSVEALDFDVEHEHLLAASKAQQRVKDVTTDRAC